MNKTASLRPDLLKIIVDKGTELPFSGEYNTLKVAGTYLCRRCGLALFRTNDQFSSGCGWPSFDNALVDAVICEQDRDQIRQEILCKRCRAHLGHVFSGEGFTSKNIRHCVNAASLDFVTATQIIDTEEAIVAAGCFWGVEHLFKQLNGIVKVEVGYTGGNKAYPTYQEVCEGITKHLEAVRLVYNPVEITYAAVIRYFFEIHDFSQKNGQGPDIGSQYQSAIFYYDDYQKKEATQIIITLRDKGYNVATTLIPVTTFWSAEDYHQNYYEKNQKTPYCHRYEKKF